MGIFSNNAITDVGRILLADVQAGAVFTPTRIVIGSGSMASGATTQSMTAVITPVVSLAINRKKRTPDGKCIFGGVYSNAEVTEPFYFRELALYAKAVYLNEDGSVKSEGEETLYSYGNAGATADYMPAHSSSAAIEKQIDLVTWVGNDAHVDLTIESGLFVTREQAVLNVQYINPDTVGYDSLLEYMVSIYDQNIIACGHFSGFSDMPEDVTILHGMINVVGGQLTISGASRTGFHYRGTNSLTQWTSPWKSSAAAGYGYGGEHIPIIAGSETELEGYFSDILAKMNTASTKQVAFGCTDSNMGQIGTFMATIKKFTDDYSHITASVYGGYMVSKSFYNNAWMPFEWINPPLVAGTEYRTVEQRGGVAVYQKLDTDGILKYRWDGSTAWIPVVTDAGGVKRSGDTMTNDLTIQKAAAPSLRLNEGSNGSGAIVQMWGNQLIIANRISANEVDNYRFFSVNNLNQQDDVAYALGLADIRGGVSNYYTVLHSGNLHVFGLGAVPASVE